MTVMFGAEAGLKGRALGAMSAMADAGTRPKGGALASMAGAGLKGEAIKGMAGTGTGLKGRAVGAMAGAAFGAGSSSRCGT